MPESRDYLLKLDRALVHLDALNTTIKRWLKTEVSAVGERDPDSGEHVVRARVLSQPAPELSLLIGDCAHNLRSALDHIAFQLAVDFTKPLPDLVAKTAEFPIFSEAAMYRRKERGNPARGSGPWKIRGADPAAQAIIETMQPYHGGDWELLAFVNELDRIDKHRKLNISIATTEQVQIRVHYARPLTRFTLVPPGPVADGQELIRYVAEPLHPRKQVKHEHTVAFGVAVAEGPYERWWASDRLQAAESMIRQNIVPALAPYL